MELNPIDYSKIKLWLNFNTYENDRCICSYKNDKGDTIAIFKIYRKVFNAVGNYTIRKYAKDQST